MLTDQMDHPVDINQNTQQIFGCSLDQVLPMIKQHNVGALISVINAQTMIDTPPQLESNQHLKLAMNDISEAKEGLVLPGEAHALKLIEFVRSWDQKQPLLIHCWAGISRSSAGVLIALATLNPMTDAHHLAIALRKASPTATPNIRLVTLADKILGRDGTLIEAADMIGRGEMAFEGEPFALPARIY